MDTQKLKNLIDPDSVSFSVLLRILDANNEYLDSDYENYIICYSTSPYPVWLWTKDDLDEYELAKIIDKLIKLYPLEEGYKYNLKEIPAEFVRRKCNDAKEKFTLVAYQMDSLIESEISPDESIIKATKDDLKLLTDITKDFAKETDTDKLDSYEQYKNNAAVRLENYENFFWQNKDGEKVAFASFIENEGKAMISLVYTFPNYRRRGYAKALVSAICRNAIQNNLTPTLYADLNYLASNACYQKIGFVEKGRIITLEAN